ncbi:MAG: dihydrodipicolinate synthase family protein [Anaerolineae bacterium]|nr:dihydrodipicolinate synthase family protein [Anaerolineae bacterium]
MSKPAISLSGVFPPIITPFDADGSVAYDALSANLERWNAYDLAGYVVLGSNGEGPYLDGDERARILDVCRQAIPPGKLLIAGTGSESTRAAIALTRLAAEAGADAALVVTPHYYGPRMTPDALVHHYHQLAGASPIPIILYNVPKATHLDMDAATIARAAQHPNVVGLKESSGNVAKLADVIRLCGPDFQAMSGTASAFFPSLAVGAVGGVLALANIAPQRCIDLYRLFQAGRWAEAADLQRRMIPVNAAITARYDIAGLKAALDMLGYYGGPVRSPLLDLSDADRQSLRAILADGGILPSDSLSPWGRPPFSAAPSAAGLG